MRKIIIYMVLFVATSLLASEIHWAKDYHEGVKESQKTDKPMLVVYSRHTCKYCVQLNNTTFKDAKVIQYLNENFVSIISYSDENDFIPPALRTPSTPTIWFLFPTTEPMFQPILGAVDAKNFYNALQIVKKEFDENRLEAKPKKYEK